MGVRSANVARNPTRYVMGDMSNVGTEAARIICFTIVRL